MARWVATVGSSTAERLDQPAVRALWSLRRLCPTHIYLTAAGSATESAAILDICLRLRLIDQKPYEQGKGILDRVVAMLVKLASALE